MRSCNCLNIQIESEGDDFEKVIQETLNLTEFEIKDSFFKQDLLKVKKLVNISKILPGIVQTRTVGSWTVSRCINCNVQTHAVHKEKGASLVLISHCLLKSDVIGKLKASGAVSSIYNIVINPDNIDFDNGLIDTYLSPEAQQIIKSIGQICSDVLRKESLAIEDRIRKFKEQQYDMLNNLKDKAFREQQQLVSVIKSDTGSTNLHPSVLKRSTSAQSQEKSSQVNNSTGNANPKVGPKRQKSTPITHTPSFDAEGLFDFEGAEEAQSVPNSDVDESDKEDKDDGGKIGRGRVGSISIAKSLPVNIPAFLTPSRFEDPDDFDDILPKDPMEIAANIQALAKSVHGDAVFGDLPRPRFSNQY